MSETNEPAMEQQAQSYVEQKSADINDKDLKRVINNQDKIEKKLQENSTFERVFTDTKLFLGLVNDYYKGNYRKIPYKSLAAGVAALLYIINPVDIVPDFIPLVGYIDDAMVIGFCIKLVESDLEAYRHWKNRH